MPTYKIVRFFANRAGRFTDLGRTGLTLEQAQEHCRGPEASSRTCTKAAGVRREHGPWFDGYVEE